MTNKQKATVETHRLMGIAVFPPGSVRLAHPVSILKGGPLTSPGATSVVTDTTYWKVPMTMGRAYTWFTDHAPGGLHSSTTGRQSDHGVTTIEGMVYNGPLSQAWDQASLEVSIAKDGSGSAAVRVDAQVVWLNPMPYKDEVRGPRMRVTLSSGCPATDLHRTDVRNPGPALTRSFLPQGQLVAGLICEYSGMSTVPVLHGHTNKDHAFRLIKRVSLDRSAAVALAQKIDRIQLGHAEGVVTSCPAEFGGGTVVALSYPDHRTVDLWQATDGCPSLSNGYILAYADLSLP